MKNLSKKLLIPLSLGLLVASCSPEQSTDNMGAENMGAGNMEASSMQRASVNTALENQNVVTVLNSYSSLIHSKDVAAMEALVLPNGTDFTIFEGKGTNIGWADYRDNHLAPEFAMEDLVFTKYDYKNYKTNVAGDLATASFSIDMAYTYKGKASNLTKHGTAILKKVNGAWKIAHLHTS